jgi:zinc/manganese transport system substrate-binding protein
MPHTLSRRALARGLSILLLCAACTLCAAKTARAKTTVVASIPELAAIAAEVGGDAVTVHTIAKPGQDYHSIEPRPSDVARLARAALVVRTGADLDSWMSALTNATGNTQLRAGGRRSVDTSQGIPKIEVPTGSISGAQGDVHPAGNPHFYYDPVYAVFAARNITRGLVRADAANAAVYRAGYSRFARTWHAAPPAGNARLLPSVGAAW